MTNPWISHPLKQAKAGEPVVGWYGGHPRGIRSHQWPRCKVCGNPMCHMGQFDAGAALDLQGFARMSMFICHATGGRCEDWDCTKGSNAVLLQRVRDNQLYDGPPTVRVYRRMQLTTQAAVDEATLTKGLSQSQLGEALQTIKVDKLGGGAVWLTGNNPPLSASGSPMRMVAQLTTSLVHFDITPKGMAYVFLDPDDKTEAAGRLMWQSG